MLSIPSGIRKLFVTVGILALLTMPALAAESPQIAYTAKVTESAVQLYSGNSFHSDSIMEIPQNETVVLLSAYESNGWVAASYEGEDEACTGYINTNTLELQSVGSASVLSDGSVLYAQADEDADSVAALSAGDKLSILGYDEGWFYVETQDELGYLPLQEVQIPMETAGRVNLRSGPGTDYESYGKISKGIALYPLSSEGEWVEVTYDGETGYVSSDYLTVSDSYTVEDPYCSGEAVVEFASRYLGNRYVWGGTSLENGCDCSGYVMKVYEEFGVDLPHSSRSIRNYGKEVSYQEMEVGDVVCYSGHVGIYAGDGQIINALNSRSGICYTDVNYSPIVTIRRML